jgi:hypothetical protein
VRELLLRARAANDGGLKFGLTCAGFGLILRRQLAVGGLGTRSSLSIGWSPCWAWALRGGHQGRDQRRRSGKHTVCRHTVGLHLRDPQGAKLDTIVCLNRDVNAGLKLTHLCRAGSSTGCNTLRKI